MLGSGPKEREFLLFSDCLVWLSNADKSDEADRSSTWDILSREPSTHDSRRNSAHTPPLVRTRSKSDADLPTKAAMQRRSEAGGKLGKLAAKKRLATGGGGAGCSCATWRSGRADSWVWVVSVGGVVRRREVHPERSESAIGAAARARGCDCGCDTGRVCDVLK